MADPRVQDRFTGSFFGQIPKSPPVTAKTTPIDALKEMAATFGTSVRAMVMPIFNAQQMLPPNFFEGKKPLDPTVDDVARDYGPNGELRGTRLPAGYAVHPVNGKIYAVNEKTDRLNSAESLAQLASAAVIDPLIGVGAATAAATRLASPFDPSVVASGIQPKIPKRVQKLWTGRTPEEQQNLLNLAKMQVANELTYPPISGPRSGSSWFPGAKQKLSVPVEVLDEQRKTVPHATNRPVAPVAPLAWSDLQGQTIVPLVGDRTQAGVDLTAVAGQRLTNPVHLEGGMDYMRHNPAAWASERSAMASLANRLPEIENPVGVYTPMGGTASDYALMTIDALHNVWSPAAMTKKGRAAVNKAIKTGVGVHNPGNKGYPDAPPIGTKAFNDRIRTDADLRKAYIQALSKASARAEGAYDIGIIRHAITDPFLRNLPNPTSQISNQQMMGGGVTDLSPTGKMAPSTHGTYDTDLLPGPKGYLGRAPFRPRDLVMRDFTRQRRSPEGGHPSSDARSLLTGPARIPQAVDQELIDAFGGYDFLLQYLK